MIPGEGEPQSVRQCQHPLAHGQAPEHAVHQMGRQLGHAPAAARRTESPPLAREGNQDLALDWGLVKEPSAAYDLVYAPGETPWLREAKKAGIPCANGLGMLIEQAALSFELWTGRKDGVREAMREALESCKI